MKQSVSLLDMLALKTLTAGVALLQGDSAVRAQKAHRSNFICSQFQYFIQQDETSSPATLAAAVYRLVCRTSFAAPGFALIRQTQIKSSKEQRQAMIELKENLSIMHQAMVGPPLEWFTLNRFDQKETTRPHRDAGPAQSVLIIGYEPSKIRSDLWVADYSACAHQLGLSPLQFLEEFNPMYAKGMHHLAPYVMPVEDFDSKHFNMLVVNNSSTALDRQAQHWQGLLHSAAMRGRVNGGTRIINSAMIAPQQSDGHKALSAEAVEHFLSSDKTNQY